MKKFIFSICLSLFILIGFQSVNAQTGTCGTNVKYTISGNTISFSREDPSSVAVWADDCRTVFQDKQAITVVDVVDVIQGIDTISISGDYYGMFTDCTYVEIMNLSMMDVSNVMDGEYEMYYMVEFDTGKKLIQFPHCKIIVQNKKPVVADIEEE